MLATLLRVLLLAVPLAAAPGLSVERSLDVRNTKTCHLTALGGGQDDAPNLLKAFDDCKKDSVIVLDGNYTSESGSVESR